MNATNNHGNLAIPHIGSGKKAISRIALCVMGALLLTPFLAQAASVTINLGLTAQNFTQTGIGPNSSGLGQWFITMGACAPVGPNTTCILSGSFTGTAPGLTSGTYSLRHYLCRKRHDSRARNPAICWLQLFYFFLYPRKRDDDLNLGFVEWHSRRTHRSEQPVRLRR